MRPFVSSLVWITCESVCQKGKPFWKGSLYRSFLPKSPTKETIFCKRDLVSVSRCCDPFCSLSSTLTLFFLCQFYPLRFCVSPEPNPLKSELTPHIFTGPWTMTPFDSFFLSDIRQFTFPLNPKIIKPQPKPHIFTRWWPLCVLSFLSDTLQFVRPPNSILYFHAMRTIFPVGHS